MPVRKGLLRIKIARESDGRVSITVKGGPAATVTPVEARLLAIKLLLAAEDLSSVQKRDQESQDVGGIL